MIARDGVGVPSNWPNACGLHWASLGFLYRGGWISQSKYPTKIEQASGFHGRALAATQQHNFCGTQLIGRVTSPRFKRKKNRIYLWIAELQVQEEHVGLAIWFYFWKVQIAIMLYRKPGKT